MKLKLLLLVGLFSLFSTPSAIAEDDFQYWSQYIFKLYNKDKIGISLFTEGRFYDDASDNGLHLVQPKFVYHISDYLDLGANYAFIQYRTTNSLSGDFEFKYQHRAEVEVNPHWVIGAIAKFHNRNRVEFRWIENKGSHNTRSRHRFRLTFPFKDNKWFKGIYIDSEFFYNWAENDYDENRTTPLGLKFKLTNNCSLNTYYMIQAKRGSNDWRSNQILGTLLIANF